MGYTSTRSLSKIELSRVYRISRPPDFIKRLINEDVEEFCKEKPEECAKNVKKYFKDRGIDVYYISDFPDTFIVKGELPQPYQNYFTEIKPQSIIDKLGFSEQNIRCIFQNGVKGPPYRILQYPPNECEPYGVNEVIIYYDDLKYKHAWQKIMKPYLSNFPINVHIEYKQLTNLDELLGEGGLKIALLSRERFRKEKEHIASIKVRSYSDKISRLQLVDGDKLLEKMKMKKEVEYYIANLLSAIYFKIGCTPFYVDLPSPKYSYLQRALYIGVAIAKPRKADNNYLKGVAIIMTGKGKIIEYVNKDFILEGRSLEFQKSELEKFVKVVKEHIDNYKERFGPDLPLVVVLRSRKFVNWEWKVLKHNFYKPWLALVSKNTNLLVMSYYKTMHNIGRSHAIHVGDRGHGVWLVQLRKFKYAVHINYYTTADDPNLPVTTYLYLRALDFTSLNLNRTTLPPIKYAKRYLKWRILEENP
jgi:hypothetical protein